MWGWSERNLECADALVGDGRLMTSAAVARSVAADCGEYPGVVCARSGRASTSVTVSTSFLFIYLGYLCAGIGAASSGRPIRPAVRERRRWLHEVWLRPPLPEQCCQRAN